MVENGTSEGYKDVFALRSEIATNENREQSH